MKTKKNKGVHTMKRIGILIGVSLVLTGMLYGIHNDFPIGVYSCPESSNYITLMDKADSAHFNLFGMRYRQIGEDDFWDALYRANTMGMDMRISDDKAIIDTTLSNGGGFDGIWSAAKCNSFWYDAENSRLDDLVHTECPDYWYYGMRSDTNRTGNDFNDNYAQGAIGSKKTWECSENAEDPLGYAVEFLRMKHIDRGLTSQIVYQEGVIDTFFFDFVMKFDTTEYVYNPTTEVCTVYVMVQDTLENYIPLPLHAVQGANYNTVFTEENFINIPDSVKYPRYNEFTFYTPWDEFPASTKKSGGRLHYVFFQVYWNGIGNLYIDGMQIEDNFYRKLKNGEYDTVITGRMNDFTGYDNINHFYGYDEPQPPQFDAFKEVKEVLETENRVYATAMSDWLWHAEYNPLILFDYLAEPDVLLEDYYPIEQPLKWNIHNTDDDRHVQYTISEMLEYYGEIHSNTTTPWYAIIQSYGNWERYEDGQWSARFLPPSKTLKALSFLPLCYDAGGILYFTFDTRYGLSRKNDDEEIYMTQKELLYESEPNESVGSWQIRGLVNDENEDNYGSYNELTPQYYAAQEANAELTVLSHIIDSLHWEGAGLACTIADSSFAPAELDSIVVFDTLTYHPDYTEGYDGFVEAGIFEDTGIPENNFFMLVNRRANFSKSEFTINDTTYNIPEEVDSAFVAADPQTVTFYFSGLSQYAECAFTDMFTEEIIISQVSGTGEVDITLTIGPGDGRLIQMKKRHIPSIIDSIFVVPENSDFTIDYPVEVTENGTLIILSNAILRFGENDSLKVYGEISIADSVMFTSPDSVIWGGLHLMNPAAEVTMNNATFERCKLHNDSRSLMISNSEFINSSIEQSGSKINVSETIFNSSNIFCERLNSCESEDMDEVYITGCEFINFSDYYAVSISTYPTYNLSDNEISNCFAGFRIVESGHPMMGVIQNNKIRWNTNGIGICIYHSYADISGHNKIIGNLIGILGAQNSSIKIKGSIDYPYQRISDNIYEEIVTDCYSFPHKKGIRYNEIVDDEYIEGTRDQYLFVCKGATGAQRELNVEYNYWGEGCLNWNEGDGDKRFYPAELFDYIPVWDPGVPEYPEMSAPELLYADADSFIQIEEYEQAKIVYRDIIQFYPECKFAIFSMRNLLPLETVCGQNFSSLQQYYLIDPNCNINDERTKLSQYLANYCSIKMEQYPEAISFFEDIISDPDTELDSVYAVIDAGYTYLLMDNGGKSDYVGKMAELKPKSVKEFRIMSDGLLSELFEIIQTEPEEPNVGYTFDLKHNYPNPFNTSTTISFSLPLSTKKAELKIYNIKGQLVRKLDMDTKSGIGSISWDGRDSNGKKVGSGIYFYKLTADKKEIVKKMVLMR